ncbi:class I SAM-dependent methyltransferase [Patescibacteria group bacterium]|nr:class I SAM-dependent methyltransferase [Patescibacteria group bacterium]
MSLIDSLITENWLKTSNIIEAFLKIKRVDFLPEDIKNLAELNEALPIGSGQTISQPLVVAFMLELLQPHLGDKILDIGYGSGWTTALLAEIVGQKGKVIAIEIVPEIKEFGESNVSKYNFIKNGIVEVILGDGSKGYSDLSSRSELTDGFDNILASASAKKIPQAWKDQVKVGGRIVTPIGNSIWLFQKESENQFKETEYPGFTFVPLITK